jgi:pimeloyl-ACP methyl ester carboxylesterase
MEFVDRLRIPIWLEARAPLEQAALLRHPVTEGNGLARGDGKPVMLIPGFLAGDLSLRGMARWLRDLGYRPCRARIRANVDCTERAVSRLESELERLVDEHRRPVTVIGQSRGGTMARILAVRRPDLIEMIICLGSPLTDQFAVHPLVRAQVRMVAALGSLGVSGLFSFACRNDCCASAERDLAAPFPPEVRYVSVFSRSDGIVDWRTCLDPAAELVEVDSTHVGMAVNAYVYRAIASALARTAADRDSALAA